jgi:phasin family protein
MESKGRRAGRAVAPAEADKTAEIAAQPIEATEAPPEPPSPADMPAEVMTLTPTETSADVTTPAAVEKSGTLTSAGRSAADGGNFAPDALAALAQSQAALARGLEALSAEMAGLALSGIDTAARTATKMLGVKTLSDAIEVNAGLTRSSFDALMASSRRLSELGVKLAAETSRPLLRQLSKSWMKTA